MQSRERLYEAEEVAKMLGKSEPKIQSWIGEHLGEQDIYQLEGKKKITESGLRKLAWLSEFTLKQPILFRSLMKDLGGTCQCQELREQVRNMNLDVEHLTQDNQLLTFNWELEKQKRRVLEQRVEQLMQARDEALRIGQGYCDELTSVSEQVQLLQQEQERLRKHWWRQIRIFPAGEDERASTEEC